MDYYRTIEKEKFLEILIEKTKYNFFFNKDEWHYITTDKVFVSSSRKEIMLKTSANIYRGLGYEPWEEDWSDANIEQKCEYYTDLLLDFNRYIERIKNMKNKELKLNHLTSKILSQHWEDRKLKLRDTVEALYLVVHKNKL